MLALKYCIYEPSDAGSYGQGIAHELTEIRDELLKTLVEFDACNAGLRRQLRDQQEGENKMKLALSQQELILSRLIQSEGTSAGALREVERMEDELRLAKNAIVSNERQFETTSMSVKRFANQVCKSPLNLDQRELVHKFRTMDFANSFPVKSFWEGEP